MTPYMPDVMRGQFGQVPDIARGNMRGFAGGGFGGGMGNGMDYAGLLQQLLGGGGMNNPGMWTGGMGGMGGMMPWQGGGLPAGMGMFGNQMLTPEMTMARAYSDATTPQQAPVALAGNPNIGPGGPARPIY